MGIGASILVIAVGAILAFAVNWHVSGIDLQVVGWILMLAGLASVVLFFTFWNRRRPAAVPVSREVIDQVPPAPPRY